MKKAEMIAKYGAEWYENKLQKHREWRKKNKEKLNEYKRKRKKQGLTTLGERLDNLLFGYRQSDKRRNNGDCTLTKEDLLNLFKNGCYYCGETDWHKLGVDRIDNSKPHTIDNCVCSCWPCNHKSYWKTKEMPIIQYTIDGEFVTEYQSICEASRQTGIAKTSISSCCNHKIKKDGKGNYYHCNTAGGYKWEFKSQP